MKISRTTATETLVALAATPDDQIDLLSQLVVLGDDGAPPREFQLLAAGDTRTTKGVIRCDAAHATLCLAAETMPADGLLPLDYDHGMVSMLGAEKKAAGWFKLSNRNGALWATDVKYTPAAEKALRDREYRYFSPALYRDEEGYVTRMVNCALTCLPATLKQTPLVASEATPAQPEGSDMTLEQLCAAFGVQNATQLAAKFNQLQADAAKQAADNSALLTASQAQASELALVKTALAARTAQDAQAEKTAYIAQLSSEGKLAPALKPWAEGQTLDALKTFGAHAPVISAVAVAAKVEAPVTDPSKQALELSAEELAMCSQMKVDPKNFAAQKALLSQAPAAGGPLNLNVGGVASAEKATK
jgi:phage I-like protein